MDAAYETRPPARPRTIRVGGRGVEATPQVRKGSFIGLSVEFHYSHVKDSRNTSCADLYGRNDDRCEAEFSQESMAGTARRLGLDEGGVYAVAFGRSCPDAFSACHLFSEDFINVGADASITGRVYLNPSTFVGPAEEEMMPARVLVFDPA